MARAVATALEVVLVGRRELPAAVNLEAYESYLRGRMLDNRGTEEALRAAIAPLEKALALDPEYVDALNELGYVYANQWGLGYDYDEDILRRAEQLARRSLELEDRNPGAQPPECRVFGSRGRCCCWKIQPARVFACRGCNYFWAS